jgi:hypothetical protein
MCKLAPSEELPDSIGVVMVAIAKFVRILSFIHLSPFKGTSYRHPRGRF